MNRKGLLLLAIICAILGLGGLFLASVWLEDHPEETALLTLTGEIRGVNSKGKTTFIKIIPSSELLVVSFKQLDVQKEETVTLAGRLQEYQGRVEFVVEKVQ